MLFLILLIGLGKINTTLATINSITDCDWTTSDTILVDGTWDGTGLIYIHWTDDNGANWDYQFIPNPYIDQGGNSFTAADTGIGLSGSTDIVIASTSTSRTSNPHLTCDMTF